MSSCLLYLFELLKQVQTFRVAKMPAPEEITSQLIVTGSFIAVTFFLLLLVLSLHQDWESTEDDSPRQILWLGFISNAVGLSLLASFILWVKGV